MGGRNRGCRTCKKRKVKCDQTKPTCKRCETGRFVCHGYEPYMEFVNETYRFPHALAHQHTKGVNHQNPDQSAKYVVAKADPAQPLTPRVRDDETRMAVDLAYALDSPNTSFRHLGWMISVLQHPETPRPLSYSVCALASVFIGRANTTSLVLRRGVEIYYKALRLVQSQVRDQMHVYDEDLPLSVLCLCVYELVAPTRSGAWISHASGLAKIIELHGPEKYTSGYRRETFHALRYIVVSRSTALRFTPPLTNSRKILGCLAQKRRCFLEEVPWKIVPWGADYPEKSLLDSLHDIFSALPGILENMERLKNADKVLCSYDTASDILFHDVLSALDELYQWRLKWNVLHGRTTAVPEGNPGHAVTEINTCLLPAPISVKRFGNLQSAAELCLFNAIVLILVRIGETLRNRHRTVVVGLLKWPQELFISRFGSSQYLSEEIVQLAPYMSEAQHGNKGIYLLSFPLQIARSRLDPDSAVLNCWVENTMGSMNDNLGVYIPDDI